MRTTTRLSPACGGPVRKGTTTRASGTAQGAARPRLSPRPLPFWSSPGVSWPCRRSSTRRPPPPAGGGPRGTRSRSPPLRARMTRRPPHPPPRKAPRPPPPLRNRRPPAARRARLGATTRTNAKTAMMTKTTNTTMSKTTAMRTTTADPCPGPGPEGCLVTGDRCVQVIVDHGWMQVIAASRPEWSGSFTGLQPGQFRKLVRVVAQRGGDEIADGRPGRQWRLDSAAHRVIDTLGPLLARPRSGAPIPMSMLRSPFGRRSPERPSRPPRAPEPGRADAGRRRCNARRTPCPSRSVAAIVDR